MVKIPKAIVVELIRSRSGDEKANQAGNELPDKIDTDTDAELLQKYSIDPVELVGELTAIKTALGEWQKYCSTWAEAYRGGAQSALFWNSWLVSIGITLAAITTILSAIGGAGTLGGLAVAGLAIAGAGVGAGTTAVNGLQKLSWSSPEQIKQCHSAAAAYECAKRDIDSALTNVDLAALRKQRDTIKQQINSTDTQAPELRGKFRKRARGELPPT